MEFTKFASKLAKSIVPPPGTTITNALYATQNATTGFSLQVPPITFQDALYYAQSAYAFVVQSSLVIAYAFEPFVGHAYHDWFFAMDSPLQRLFNSIPYKLFRASLRSAFSFLYPAVKEWFLGFQCVKSRLSALSSISEAGFIPRSLPYVRAGATYSWIAVSTPAAAAIWAVKYYFEHVKDPDYRFLFIAFIALCAYGIVVLGIWHSLALFTIRASIALLRISLKLANKVLKGFQMVICLMERNMRHVEGVVISLVNFAHWGLRIMSLVVLFSVDKLMEAFHETRKLQLTGTAAPASDLYNPQLSYIVRKLAVWLYVVYLAWTSWKPVIAWLYSFKLVFCACWIIRFNVLAVWEIIHLVISLSLRVLFGILSGLVIGITSWLYRFRITCWVMAPFVGSWSLATMLIGGIKSRLSLRRKPSSARVQIAQLAPTEGSEDVGQALNTKVRPTTVLPGQYAVSNTEVKEEADLPRGPRRSPRLQAKRLRGNLPQR